MLNLHTLIFWVVCAAISKLKLLNNDRNPSSHRIFEVFGFIKIIIMFFTYDFWFGFLRAKKSTAQDEQQMVTGTGNYAFEKGYRYVQPILSLTIPLSSRTMCGHMGVTLVIINLVGNRPQRHISNTPIQAWTHILVRLFVRCNSSVNWWRLGKEDSVRGGVIMWY